MAVVIPFDRRATHRVISDVSAFDRILDVDALAQDGIGAANNVRFLHNEVIVLARAAHFRALGTGDSELVRLIGQIHDSAQTQVKTIKKLGGSIVHIRRIAQEGAALVTESMTVDPYLAALHAHTDPTDAA